MLKRHVGCHTVELIADEWGWTKPSFIRRGQTDRHFERRYICIIKVGTIKTSVSSRPQAPRFFQVKKFNDERSLGETHHEYICSVCYNIYINLLPIVFLQSVAPGKIVSVLLSAKTKGLVSVLEHQFQNCLHKLKLVTEDGSLLLAGGGRTEAMCVAKLRQKLAELNTELSNTDLLNDNSENYTEISTEVSFAMATSWMGDRTRLTYWRPHVYEVCIQGLLEYISRVIMNSRCTDHEVDGGHYGVGHYGAMAKAEELVRNIERDVLLAQSGEMEVLDVAKSKVGAWRRAVGLLRLLFLSTRITSTIQKMTYARYRPI